MFWFYSFFFHFNLTSIFNCEGRLKEKCNVKYFNSNNRNKDKVYFDSFLVYFSNLKYQMNNKKPKFLIEVIIITPLIILIKFLQINFEILMIYYLNPIYILVYESLFYLFIGIISSSLNSNFNTQSFLTILANIFSLLGYLIYAEVIELRFCGLNEKTKRILELKGKNEILFEFKDLNPIFIEEDDDNDDDNDLNK